MIRHSKRIVSSLIILVTLGLLVACAKGSVNGPKSDAFQFVDKTATTILVEGKAEIGHKEGDYPGVVRAAEDLKKDILDVLDKNADIIDSVEQVAQLDSVVIVGSLDKSEHIKKLIDLGKIDESLLKDKWESYILKT